MHFHSKHKSTQLSMSLTPHKQFLHSWREYGVQCLVDHLATQMNADSQERIFLGVQLSLQELRDAVVNIYENRKNLAATLTDTKNVVANLERVMTAVVQFVLFFAYLAIWKVGDCLATIHYSPCWVSYLACPIEWTGLRLL